MNLLYQLRYIFTHLINITTAGMISAVYKKRIKRENWGEGIKNALKLKNICGINFKALNLPANLKFEKIFCEK